MSPAEPCLFVLENPIVVGGAVFRREVCLIRFRRPTAKDLAGLYSAGGDPAEFTLKLASRLSSIPVAALEAMAASDFFRLTNLLNEMLNGAATSPIERGGGKCL